MNDMNDIKFTQKWVLWILIFQSKDRARVVHDDAFRTGVLAGQVGSCVWSLALLVVLYGLDKLIF